jgi:hypothetical protein
VVDRASRRTQLRGQPRSLTGLPATPSRPPASSQLRVLQTDYHRTNGRAGRTDGSDRRTAIGRTDGSDKRTDRTIDRGAAPDWCCAVLLCWLRQCGVAAVRGFMLAVHSASRPRESDSCNTRPEPDRAPRTLRAPPASGPNPRNLQSPVASLRLRALYPHPASDSAHLLQHSESALGIRDSASDSAHRHSASDSTLRPAVLSCLTTLIFSPTPTAANMRECHAPPERSGHTHG